MKKTSKKTKYIMPLFCLFALAILWVITLVVIDNRNNTQAKKSLERLKPILVSKDFSDVKQGYDCFRTQVKYGDGAKICSVRLITTVKTLDEVDAKLKYQVYNDVLRESGFQPKKQIVDFRPKNNVDFGSNFFTDPYSEKICAVHYEYGLSETGQAELNSESDTLTLELSCDITNWFDRTFNDGQFSF